MPTRSSVLGASAAAAGVPVTIGTVPAGTTWIAKSAFMADQGGLGGLCFVWFRRNSTGVLGIFAVADYSTVPFGEWEGWVVGEPGDVLEVFSDTTLSHVWVSGAELPGVAP